MSLFESASLVVTPNGTKASKLYAIKPTDGSGDLTVTRATTATRVNASGLISSVASNVPRLDYTNSTCPSILVEPQRTNLLTYSQEFDNAAWGKEFTTITANNIISPDGTQNAERFNLNGGTEQKFLFQAAIQNGTYTQSVYFKKGTHTFVQLAVGGDVNPYCNFDLTNGTFAAFGSSATMTNVGNDWYRCTMTYTSAIATFVFIFASNSLSSARTSATSSTGNFYAWGAQIESGSYATSYIPTTSASVTRNADVISKTGISSLIGQTEGTLFLDWKFIDYDTNGIIAISLDNDSGNGTYFYIDGTAKIYCDFIVGGTILSSISTATNFATKNTRYKMAIAYKANDFAFYINGNLIGTDTSGSVVQFSKLALNYPYASGYLGNKNVNLTALWKTRLTNVELAQLTTI